MEFRIAIAREFQTLARLRHPNIISVLDYGFDTNNTPFFTMELLEEAKPFIEAAEDLDLNGKIDLLIQILQALAYLHRRTVIHRDLKPANVLVANGRVKVMDFGLSVETFSESAKYHTDTLAGTAAYFSPEALTEQLFSRESDFWAVGVMIYELMTKSHPFDTRTIGAQIMSIMTHTPDFNDELLRPLTLIVKRLLSKNPADRYGTADEIISTICQVSNYPYPQETIAIRESFLGSAKFVGREDIFNQLTTALQTAKMGKGSAWLIGGESGVGKSRLLEELRIRSLVDGAYVLQGEAKTEHGAPYQMWRGILRRLCLLSELSRLDASILKSLVPDIASLLNQDVEDAPEVDPQSAQQRLLMTIENIFRNQNQPIVLLLEDLQWADDSLEILKRINRIVSNHPLLVIGTFRDDEQPNLPMILADMNYLTLERLEDQAIGNLVVSILGENGKKPDLINFLIRETEGNIFFILEVMRYLSEGIEHLTDILKLDLPKSAFSGGMRTVVQRRLEQIPEQSLALLSMAAIAGRALDLNLLQTIAKKDNLEDWLRSVSSVLDVRDNQYIFSHDKLREGLLDKITAEQAPNMHRKIAETIEQIYPDNNAYSALLAFHWDKARDLVKAVHYSIQAGNQALTAGSYREATAIFNRTIELAKQLNFSDVERAHLEFLLGRSYLSTGIFREAADHLFTALALLGHQKPKRLTPSHFLRGFAIHVWTRVKIDLLGRSQHDATEAYKYAMMAHIAYHLDVVLLVLNQAALGLFYLVKSLNWAEMAAQNANDVLFTAYSALASAFSNLGFLNRMYQRRADSLLPSVQNTAAYPDTLLALGVSVGYRGQKELSDEYLNKCLASAASIGNTKAWLNAKVTQVAYEFNHGEDWNAFATCLEELRIANRQHNDNQMIETIIACDLMIANLRGNNQIAHQLYQETRPTIEALSFTGTIYYYYGATIIMHWKAGNIEQAFHDAETLLTMIEPMPGQPLMLYPVTALLEFYFVQWQLQPSPTVEKLAQRALATMKPYSNLYEHGKPIFAFFTAWKLLLTQKQQKAYQQAEKALAINKHYHMPFYEGLFHHYLGQYFYKDATTSRIHRDAANSIFEKLGVNLYSNETYISI
jgi:serine/threonine protein kinase